MMDAEAKQVIADFLSCSGYALDQADLEPIPADGSKRSFWRVRIPGSGQSWIAMSNPPSTEPIRWENYAYLKIGVHLHQKGIPIPRLYRHDMRLGFFILQDMGSTHLQEAASAAPDPLPLYEHVLKLLLNLQVEGARGFEPSWCWQTQQYDLTVMRIYEAHYFRDAFLRRYLGLQEDWSRLEKSFSHLARTAARAGSSFFLHRDFQSRNLVISRNRIGILDWQGGRLGPLAYDLASLLYDPYSPLTSGQRKILYNYYVGLVEDRNGAWTESVVAYFPYLALQRNLQILGAFAHLTQAVGKPHFELYIPKALQTLQTLLQEIDDPELLPLRDLAMELALPQKALDTPPPPG